MMNFIKSALLLILLVSHLSGEGLNVPGHKLVVFNEWTLDLGRLELVEIENLESANIVWNVNEEPRLWDQPDLGIDGVNFPVYYSDSSILGYLISDPVMPEPHTITGSKIIFKLQPDNRILWIYNPEPPLFYGHYLKFILSGYKLYIAIYDPISSGSGLVCLNIKTGEEIWIAEVEQLMVDHSQYMNEVHIKLIDDMIIMVGDEAGGYYLQVFDWQSGERLFCETNHL